MTWEFKKSFYGKKEELHKENIRKFLEDSYYFIPYTIFHGLYRVVYCEGDLNYINSKIKKPFPDILIAQNPGQKFAMHFSGGLDSAVLAKLYDREDVDYLHVGVVEDKKAKAMADNLKGKFHHINVTPKDFIAAAEEALPQYAEPEPDAASLLAYIASKKAKELGHALIVTGDCGDTIFGGHLPKPHSEKAMVIWKTLHPNQLLGLKTFMPYGHPALKVWARATLEPREYDFEKLFLKEYARSIGLPKEITEQKKLGWGGCWDYATNEVVDKHMKGIISNSKYKWVSDLVAPEKRMHKTTFREYSLVKWLERNDK
ncbi:asparagine synthase C-terminal domain-containing protein [Thermoproteota archaeon]